MSEQEPWHSDLLRIRIHPDSGAVPSYFPGRQREVNESSTPDSTMNNAELVELQTEAQDVRRLGPFLEVGAYHGRTTAFLAQINTVVAIDWLGGNVELAPPERRTATGWSPAYQLDHLLPNLDLTTDVTRHSILLACDSATGLYLLRHETFSLILLDAAKDEATVLADLERAWPLLAPGGTLFLDDFYSQTFDEPKGTVARAWEAFARKHRLTDLPVDLYGVQPGSQEPKLARIRKPPTDP